MLATTLFVVAALFVGAWLSWDVLFYRLATYSIWADYWEHTATFTEWLRNFDAPGNPHVATAELSPRYMPWFWLLTWAGVQFGWDSIDLMAVSSIGSYLVIVIGIYLFSRAYFRDYWAPLITFLAFFTFWGVSWNWSNLYQLRSFFYIAGYPSSLTFGISLIAFWAVLKTLRKDASLPLMAVVIAVLAALMFLCHPLTGVFGLAGCALLTLTDYSGWNRYRITVLGALLAGALAAELWPYFSVWKLTLGIVRNGRREMVRRRRATGAH